MGNFLNNGSYSGNAVGFQLKSLLTLSDVRTNKDATTLLHFVAKQAHDKKPQLLDLLDELDDVQRASA